MTFRERFGLKMVRVYMISARPGPSVVSSVFQSSQQLQLRRALNCWSWQSSERALMISPNWFLRSVCFVLKVSKCKSMPAVLKSFTLSGSLKCKLPCCWCFHCNSAWSLVASAGGLRATPTVISMPWMLTVGAKLRFLDGKVSFHHDSIDPNSFHELLTYFF